MATSKDPISIILVNLLTVTATAICTENRTLMKKTSLLSLLLILLELRSVHISAAFFLAEPTNTPNPLRSDFDGTLENAYRRKYSEILREKAKTFGQSNEEIQLVNQYLKKIQKFEIEQHPEETDQKYKADSFRSVSIVKLL
ncbi:unnamed protein product [Thelazia callipaeda]|uniref:Inhibitor_I29 domain-containing protein n=1 Tax=Thelazia callipaeda TaxID=103827 RepID=A0A0N5D349_THECL|nr:unnamed protein product [Thelazia callipaeda]